MIVSWQRDLQSCTLNDELKGNTTPTNSPGVTQRFIREIAFQEILEMHETQAKEKFLGCQG